MKNTLEKIFVHPVYCAVQIFLAMPMAGLLVGTGKWEFGLFVFCTQIPSLGKMLYKMHLDEKCHES